MEVSWLHTILAKQESREHLLRTALRPTTRSYSSRRHPSHEDDDKPSHAHALHKDREGKHSQVDLSDKSLSTYERLKVAVSKYGKTAFFVYIVLGTITLSSCYIAVSQGMDVAALMNTLGITNGPWLNPTSGTFVISYFIHKVCLLGFPLVESL